MPSKKFFIFAIILISIVLLYSGAFINKNFFDINYDTGKASVIEFNNENTNNIISFEPTIIANKNIQIPNEDEEIIPSRETDKIVDENTTEKKVTVFTCPTPKKEFEDMWLLNINQNTGLPDETYIPKNLEKIKSKFTNQNNICLTKEAKENLEIMLTKVREDGYDIRVTSGFRTYNTQKDILNNAINNGNTNANTSIAKAGYSEHQLGTTVDLTGKSIDYISAAKSFDGTNEANWLETNGSDYGFIRSYPFGKEEITGYIYEPWHYRYVGIDNAEKIITNKQTINEFLSQ